MPFLSDAGADGFLSKPYSLDELRSAIGSVLEGGFPISRAMLRRLAGADSPRLPASLWSNFFRRLLFQPRFGLETEAARFLVARTAAFDPAKVGDLCGMEIEELKSRFFVSVGQPLCAWLRAQREHGGKPFVETLGPWFVLTEREREIAGYLRKGCSHQDISKFLSVTLSTVNAHVAAILTKTGTTSALAAMWELFQWDT